MPIQFPPLLLPDAQDRKARLAAEAVQFANSAVQKQDEIDGTFGPPPGLQAEDDVQADLYSQYDARCGLFETERRALDGIFPDPPVTPAMIASAASGVRPVIPIFPIPVDPVTKGFDPSFAPGLQGGGGSDPVNEVAKLASEQTAITTLLGMALGLRLASAAYTAWVAALTSESALLATQIAAIAANESYGPLHPAYTNATAEKAAVDALLPAPGVTNAILLARQTQATARQGAVVARVLVIAADVLPFYNERYLVLKGRLRVGQGTLTKLNGAIGTIDLLNKFAQLNNDQVALYTALGA